MVKRPKSPDTAEDEKYFTIYQPYPLNANWELAEDYIAFSRWLAGCIGTAPLHALHYKPKARGMVLLEIDKKYPDNRRLLGEHKWSEFLRNPSEEERERVSQIFHSLYTTGREAQKDGWKRIHVESSWFNEWSLDNSVIMNPYPTTHWCNTPPEDRTNKPLCRPLPVALIPPPPAMRVAQPVVGSAAWSSCKTAPSQSTAGLKGAWAARQKLATQPTPAVQPKTNVPPPARESPPHIQSVSLVAPRLPPDAWKTPITQNTPTSPKPAPTAAPTPAPVQAQAQAQAQAPAYPPGLGVGPRIISSGAAIPPALVYSSGSDSSGSGSGSGSQSSWEGAAIKSLASRLEEKVTISLSPSQDRALYREAADPAVDLSPDPHTTTLHPWELHLDKVQYTYVAPGDEDDDGGNLWADEEEKLKLKPVPPEMPRCPVHDLLCKKGICKDMSKIMKEQEKAKKEQEKKNTRGKVRNGARGNVRKNSGGRGEWAQGPSNEDASTAADDDGFSTVTGRGRGRGNKNNAQGKNRGWQDNTSSNNGGGYGRNRANSASSNSGSVAGGPARSESGWTNVSNW